ncbi:MAG: hypothetical protein M3R35_06930, partial [Candidatus Eremiobacteraeota bacterium]|nr:hypothetical protein [Candidatus Eremiobacteraeota bacterium]
DLAAYVDGHRSMLILGAWLTFPASAFYLWFIVGLRAFLRQVPGRDEGLPTYALVAGLATAVITVMGAIFQTVLGFEGSITLGAQGLPVMYGAAALSGAVLFGPLAVFLLACAMSMRIHHSAPRWLAWLGYVAFIGSAISSLTVFFSRGPMAPGGIVSILVGLLLFALWVIATSIVLIRNAGRAAPGARITR